MFLPPPISFSFLSMRLNSRELATYFEKNLTGVSEIGLTLMINNTQNDPFMRLYQSPKYKVRHLHFLNA